MYRDHVLLQFTTYYVAMHFLEKFHCLTSCDIYRGAGSTVQGNFIKHALD